MEELSGTMFGELKDLVDGYAEDYLKGMKGNKAAGTRARKAMQKAKGLAHEIKKELLAVRKKD